MTQHSAAQSALVCRLRAPDTVFFDFDKYLPSPFELELEISNTGSEDAKNLKAYVLQDARFSILPPAFRNYGDLAAGNTIAFEDTTVNGPFRLKVNRRTTDGYDTMRVLVVADGFPPSFCLIPVYVMSAQSPRFQLKCYAAPDRLVFNDQLNDYVPNPFDVMTMVVNIGETKAENCQVVFLGTSNFALAQGSPVIHVGIGGRMNVLDTVTCTWKLTPLHRSVGGWDTLLFQVQGRGGMGNRLVIAECRVPIYVPATRAADYQMVCVATAVLSFENSTGVYRPDPFMFKTVITNTGKAAGRNLSVTAQLPPGVMLASGETATKLIDTLAVSASAEVKWLVRPVANTSRTDVTVKLCAKVVDKLGKKNDCCSDVIIPPATKAALGLSCDSQFETLKIDPQTGTYEKIPFMVWAKITNTGNGPADNVRVAVLPQSSGLRVLGDPERFIATRLYQMQTTDTIGWRVTVVPETASGSVDIHFVVWADGLPSKQCTKSVYIPETVRPSLSCTAQSSMACTGDTLYFNHTIGDYRDCFGTRSWKGTYNVFTITSHLLNGGVAQANRVRAILQPPEGVSLDVGETAIKDAGHLPSGGSANVSWSIKAERLGADTRRVFTVLLTSDNASQAQCEKAVTIMGVPGRTRRVRMPTGIQARTRDRISVPVYVDSTTRNNVSAYALNVQFDPEALRFMDAVSVNTLTAQGWRGPRSSLHAAAQGGSPNVVRVEDLGYRAASRSSATNILVLMIFEAVYDGGAGLDPHETPLKFLESIKVQSGGKTVTLEASIQCSDEHDPDCDAPLTFEDGSVSIIGDIRIPILGGTEYALSRNTPNPVTGSTVIEYQLGEATEVRLEVFDILGRGVAVLAQGWKPAGRYAAVFDASGMAPGVYMYRLETSSFSKARSMLLVR
ncbi:MAG: T9SS type A sorting domain-containing protein [Ignavibacteria bacterium]|nr:T9SS type A sorting domain-containing protein [Ignavibacteria bacterium]